MPSEGVLRVAETYASVQGEGPRTGMGTVFLRFGGCNLRCPGWPCDTLFAVDPSHRGEWERRRGVDVLSEVVRVCRELNIDNVCLTGGEPFIQQSDVLEYVVRGLLLEDLSVEAFSNGQVKYPEWAFDLVQFIMDWKLPGSGNAADKNEEVLGLMTDNIAQLKPTDAIKFVIKDAFDFQHALDVWCHWESTTQAQWWAGVVWDNKNLTEAQLVNLIQSEQLPWMLNVQVHKYLWSPDKRRV
jgi:7-carboxy-7-deazaguanine synthase